MPTTGSSLAAARVVVSDRAAVADDAMRLTHDVYVERGFADPAPSGRRFMAPYLNPGTRFIVAYDGDEPIATATLVADGPFGLPADRSFAEEVDQARADANTLCEVTGLAVASSWRGHTRLVLGLVLGTAVRLNGQYGAGHRAVYVVEPRQAALMSRVLIGERRYGPRPLLGSPGTLVVTQDFSRYRTFYADPTGPAARRLVGEYALDPEPTWLIDEPQSGGWRQVLLPELVEESGLLSRLERQLGLLHGARDALPTPAIVI